MNQGLLTLLQCQFLNRSLALVSVAANRMDVAGVSQFGVSVSPARAFPGLKPHALLGLKQWSGACGTACVGCLPNCAVHMCYECEHVFVSAYCLDNDMPPVMTLRPSLVWPAVL